MLIETIYWIDINAPAASSHPYNKSFSHDVIHAFPLVWIKSPITGHAVFVCRTNINFNCQTPPLNEPYKWRHELLLVASVGMAREYLFPVIADRGECSFSVFVAKSMSNIFSLWALFIAVDL